MCSAPNVYMFVYILIGTHLVPLMVISVDVKATRKTVFQKLYIQVSLSFDLYPLEDNKVNDNPYIPTQSSEKNHRGNLQTPNWLSIFLEAWCLIWQFKNIKNCMVMRDTECPYCGQGCVSPSNLRGIFPIHLYIERNQPKLLNETHPRCPTKNSKLKLKLSLWQINHFQSLPCVYLSYYLYDCIH